MWMLFGVIAIVTCILNVIFTFLKKDASWFRYLSLSFTCLTLCVFYAGNANAVLSEDWIYLMDVVPTLSNLLWYLTIALILFNSVSLFIKPKKYNH